MWPLSPTKLKQTSIYTISTHPNVLFFPAIPTYLHPMYNIGGHRRKHPPRRLVVPLRPRRRFDHHGFTYSTRQVPFHMKE